MPTRCSAFSPTNFDSVTTWTLRRSSRQREWSGRPRKAASAGSCTPPEFNIRRQPSLALSTRDENKLWVSAPYAVAGLDGNNVTADPPRTQLWCLLYAQARQADNLDSRNILLDDKQLDWRLEIEDVPDRNRFLDVRRSAAPHLAGSHDPEFQRRSELRESRQASTNSPRLPQRTKTRPSEEPLRGATAKSASFSRALVCRKILP